MKKRAKKRKSGPKQKAFRIRVGGKRIRLRASEDRAERLRQVAKLRFVQSWTNDDIAKKLGISLRQIERYVHYLRNKLRRNAEKNLSFEMRDIAESTKLRHGEIIKLLWNNYTRTVQEIEQLVGEIAFLRKKEADGALQAGTEKETLMAQLLARADKILWQITETDSAFMEQLRKLGIARAESPVFNFGIMLGDINRSNQSPEQELGEIDAILRGEAGAPASRF